MGRDSSPQKVMVKTLLLEHRTAHTYAENVATPKKSEGYGYIYTPQLLWLCTLCTLASHKLIIDDPFFSKINLCEGVNKGHHI